MNDSASAKKLQLYVERIERLEEEKSGIGADIKDVYAELKGDGFVPKGVRALVKIRKQDREKRKEEEAILETYKDALGID